MTLGYSIVHIGSRAACRQPSGLLALLSLVVLASCAEGYAGFDCGQGSALLFLAGHSQCGPSSQLVCYQTLGMKIKKCQLKAWPHKPQRQPNRPCWGISLYANVTDVNHAQGVLVGPAQGSSRAKLPASLQFNRRDESVHIQYGSCVLRFNVQEASDAALQPVPGEDAVAVSSLMALLLPAVLVPCVVVGLIVAAGNLSIRRLRSSADSGGNYAPEGYFSEGQYTQLAAEPTSSGGRVAAGGALSALGLLTHSFNFKAMSRRARARRLRRNTRVVYVGPAERSLEQQQLYASGQLQPGPQNLIAPCFRFPPVAIPPALPAIPESCTPTDSSAATSRCSSCQDIAFAATSGHALPAAVTAAAAPGGIVTVDQRASGQYPTSQELLDPFAAAVSGKVNKTTAAIAEAAVGVVTLGTSIGTCSAAWFPRTGGVRSTAEVPSL